MSKNIIAIAIITSLTVLTIYFINLYTIQLPEQQAKNDYWEQEAKYATENASLICPPSNEGKPIPPNSCKRQDHYRHDRQQQIADHKSQIRMNYAAWGGLLIGIGGLILLQWTLNATKDAAKSASDTLKQATIATAASQEMNALVRQEQRPWIYIKRSIECDFAINKNGVVRLTWFKTIQNIGKTPAYNFQFEQELIRTENVFHNEDAIEKFKTNLIKKVGGWGGEIIIPNQPNRNEPLYGQINSLLEYIKGEGENYMLITGCAYRISRTGPIGYDIQIYSLKPRRKGGNIGPMVHELIHDQYSRQLQ